MKRRLSVTVAELLTGDLLTLEPDGTVGQPVVVVDVSSASNEPSTVAAAVEALSRQDLPVLVGVLEERPTPLVEPLLEALTLTVVPAEHTPLPRTCVPVADVEAAIATVRASVSACPRAAVTLAGLLRITSRLPVAEGLVAESLAYSTLLAGAEFAEWRARTPARPVTELDEPPLLLERCGDVLKATFNRPHRHNAFSRGLRDALLEALALLRADPTLRMELTGKGRSFCSGGDLDEFGTAKDVSTAHIVRIAASAGAAVHAVRDRVRVVLHGACVGAGVEVPAFAAEVVARDDAWFQLPELRMGLVPGAGGTVSIPRRIGRWRTAWMALSGAPIDVEQALAWGLVDGRA